MWLARHGILANVLGDVPVLQDTLALNGTNQYLTLSDTDEFNIGTAYTYLTWVYADTLAEQKVIYNQRADGTNFVSMLINTNGTLECEAWFGASESYNFISTGSLSTGSWHQVGFQIDGTTVRIILDGSFDATTDTVDVSPTNLAANLDIGRWSGNGNYFDGSLAAIIIFNRAVTALEATELYNLGVLKQPWEYSQALRDSMVLALPLNSGVASGREFEDYSGYENDATATGSPTITGELIETDDTNLVYNAFAGGTSKYLQGPSDSIFDLGAGDFSFSFWIYRHSNTRVFFYMRFAGGGLYNQFEINNSNNIYFSNQSFNWFLSTTNPIPLNKWVHCVAQRNGSTAEFYMDGVANGTVAATGTQPSVAAQPWIMGDVVDSLWADADYSQYLFFKRALTPNEITVLYNSNIPLDYTNIPSVITNDCEVALNCNSEDDSGNDISGNGRNFTKQGGLAADGSEIDWDA